MAHPVVHFEVLGRDAETLQGFYREAFGWEVKSVLPEYAMVTAGEEGGIAGGIGSSPDGGQGHVTFYIQTDDLDASLEKVKAAGGSTVTPPMEVPEGPSIALFADPEGHVVGLVK